MSPPNPIREKELYLKKIATAVDTHPVVIISSDIPGWGKTTEIPQHLLKSGYRVCVTQPRRVAVTSAASYVGKKLGAKSGIVGHAMAGESSVTKQTRVIYATDGLLLAQLLGGYEPYDLLVVDEVGSRTVIIDTILALSRERFLEGTGKKLVLMGSGMDTVRLSKCFGGAPIIHLPGSQFPITEIPHTKSEATHVCDALRSGKHVQWFQPGEREIWRSIEEAQTLASTARITSQFLPLYGDMTDKEQHQVVKGTFAIPTAIVSTDIAETSLTIDNLHGVINNGLVKHIELVNGVPGLYTVPTARSSDLQRKNRAGRTRPSFYMFTGNTTRKKKNFSTPEIVRTPLDQTLLRLHSAGIGIEELPFIDPPPRAHIELARQTLRALECLDEKNRITERGEFVASLPVSVPYGVMIEYGMRFGVLDDIITAAAICEQHSIVATKVLEGGLWVSGRKKAYAHVATRKSLSDILAEVALFNTAEPLTEHECVELGIVPRIFTKVKNTRKRIERAIEKIDDLPHTDYVADADYMATCLRAICGGLVHSVFRRTKSGYVGKDGVTRQLRRDTCIRNAEWIVGMPFDLDVSKNGDRDRVVHLVTNATYAEPAWLAEMAPHLVETTYSPPRWSEKKQAVVRTAIRSFAGYELGKEIVLDSTPSDEERSAIMSECSQTFFPRNTARDFEDPNEEVAHNLPPFMRRHLART